MGLLNTASQPQIQGQAQAAPVTPAVPAQGKLNPQQQQQADLAIKQATDFILDTENANNLADMAEGGDPVAAIVEMAMPLLKSIGAAAAQGGHELSAEVIASVGWSVAHIMASVLALAKAIPQEQIEPVAKQAFQKAIEQHNAAGQQAAAPQGAAPQPQGV